MDATDACAIVAKVVAIVLQIAHRAVAAGDSKVEGGTQPVSACTPSAPRCFQSFQTCWSSSSYDIDRIDLEAQRGGTREEIAVPGVGGDVEHAAGQADQMQPRARIPFEPEIMAHPDIMIDRAAIAEADDLAQQPRGRLVVGVVIAGRDAQAVRRHQRIADRQRRTGAVAGDAGRSRPRPRREPRVRRRRRV